MPAGPAGDLGQRRGSPADGVREHRLFGDVDDPRGRGERRSGPPGGDARPVPALVDLVERGEGAGLEAEPGSERPADLAAAPGRMRADGRGDLDEPAGQRGRDLGACPPTERRELAGEDRAVGGVEHLESGLESNVVDELLGVLAGVTRATDGPQQRGLEDDPPVGVVFQAEAPGERLGDGAGPQPLLEGHT